MRLRSFAALKDDVLRETPFGRALNFATRLAPLKDDVAGAPGSTSVDGVLNPDGRTPAVCVPRHPERCEWISGVLAVTFSPELG